MGTVNRLHFLWTRSRVVLYRVFDGKPAAAFPENALLGRVESSTVIVIALIKFDQPPQHL